VLAGCGIESFRDPQHTGVWTKAGKIAAMGIRVSAGVSLHGFALNANTDLAYFGLIVPCGIQGRAVASMQQILGRPVDIEELMDRIAAAFDAPRAAETAKETVE
jgi:lipoate-protein ligase B